MRLHFVRDSHDTAIVESPMTATAAARYTRANGWRQVSRAWLRQIWMYRDERALAELRGEVEARPGAVVLAERSVGSFH